MCPTAALHRVHHDEPATCRRQFRIQRRLRKTLDIVNKGDAARYRKPLHLGQKAVDRHRYAIRLECCDQRIEPADLFRGTDRLGVDIAGRGAEVDDMRTSRNQCPCMRERRGEIEKPAAI